MREDEFGSNKNDFSYFVNMALRNTMPWTTLAIFLKDLAPTLNESREIISILLKELETLNSVLQEKQSQLKSYTENSQNLDKCRSRKISEEMSFELNEDKDEENTGKESEEQSSFKDIEKNSEDNSFVSENYVDIMNDQDFLPETEPIEDDMRVLEVIKDRVDDERYSSDRLMSEEDEKRLRNAQVRHSVEEIDNEWYTFVPNDKPWENETEILDKPKEIEGSISRENEVIITSNDSDSTPKDNSFQCTTCLKTFHDGRNLKRHEKFHIGEKPFECQTCKKRFTQKCDLNKHERIHTGEVPFECKTCKKRFTQSGSLKIHERIHSGEKPCFKTFNQPSILKVHERIHSGEVPYKCKACDKRFRSHSNLWHHEKNYHNDKET